MKFNVDKNVCIGCGACQAICPDVFEIEDDGLAAATNEATDANIEEAKDAAQGCPVGAITEEK
ncbi:MAG: ferredoxin [Bacilli bacterium]|nr:ferredoxin [Bacilli bacterium]